VFREARAALAGEACAPPTDAERVAMYRAIVDGNVAQRGARLGLGVSRRHVRVLGPLLDAATRAALYGARTIAETHAVLDALAQRRGARVDGSSLMISGYAGEPRSAGRVAGTPR
jgi:hypothetical protein